MHSSSVWVGRWGLGVFMGLWQSFGVAAKQTPLFFKPQCTIAETHILNTCWLIRFFLSQSPPPLSAPARLCLFPSSHRDQIQSGEEENEGEADCSLWTFPSSAAHRTEWVISITEIMVEFGCKSQMLSHIVSQIFNYQCREAQWNEAWSLL